MSNTQQDTPAVLSTDASLIMQAEFANPSTKMSREATLLVGEYLRLLVVAEGADTIALAHLEQNLPQLLLDF
ncbi:hypothetical protein H696_00898 [Fonticula alba]|uniref:Uncharacterized protein n=1 Tax=Fonticula alba TaxID=691883 RepID=A0A058ZG68_FONAL|nr:hypothetical protein H696_00898 [Fonticula alba]KCV73359.1 hypothetical protein H696_00898 [Fonticula alba]|eukprot:XP_009493060.1 hypothetical protein H696_00898 [Fonticula alba]